MTFFRQLSAVTRMALTTVPTRLGDSLVIVIGMACAVGALLSIMSLGTGMANMMYQGRSDRAIVLRQGAVSDRGGGAIARASVNVIADAPGIRKAADGRPALSAEVLATAMTTKKKDGGNAGITVRGIGPEGVAARPEFRLINGRMFRPGKFEVIVGKDLPTLYTNMAAGNLVDLPQGDWTIVGTFESGGNMTESGILTDAETLGAALRQPAYNSVVVLLESPAAFETFRRALVTNPALAVEVMRETVFSRRQLNLSAFTILAYVIGGIMGLGAVFGAINTMYSTVAKRGIEIATLRAMGFGGGAVMLSVLAEALVLALAGVAIGALFAWAMFNGNLANIGGTVFHLAVTPGMVVQGMIFGALLALLGSFFPARRAARQPIATALRAT